MEFDTVLRGLEIINFMKQAFLRNSRPLISVKTFPFLFDKTFTHYLDHNSKSLIAMLNQKYTVHIVATKWSLKKKYN